MIRNILVLLMLTTPVLSQTVEEYILQGKNNIESACSQWNMKGMLEARAVFERLITKSDKDWLLNYYIAYCDYRLTNYAFGENDKKAARRYVSDGIKKLKACVNEKSDCADAYALLSSFYGKKIALSPWSGFWNGPKSGRMIEKAFSLEPNNPRTHLISGISAFYTPEKWGGGKEMAKEALGKAIELFNDENVEAIMPDWGHSESYGWLGLLELAMGDTDKAKINYMKALEIDPDNGWVKYRLLPQISGNN